MPRIHDSITDLIRNTPLIEPQTTAANGSLAPAFWSRSNM
jgi:hypothetical protein